MINFTKQTNASSFITFLFLLSVFIVNAQCPVGETEVTFNFTNNYDSDDVVAGFEWDYAINGLASDAGPYNFAEPLTTCIPDGELVITVCGDWMAWWNTSYEFKITEDGSVNGCVGQNGCQLIDDNDFYDYYYGLPSCDDTKQPIFTATIGCGTSVVATEGCTNSEASNYSPCATVDDGTCQIQMPNNDCANAIPVTVSPDTYDVVSIPVNNTFNTASGLMPSCFDSYYVESPTDVFYEVEVPSSGNVAMSIPYGIDVTFYDTCGGAELLCENHSSGYNEIYGLPGGETIILQVWQYNEPAFFEFWIAALPATTTNSDCEAATPLCGTLITDNNENANYENDDPSISCIGSYGGYNSVWYSFTADDSGQPISVFIEEEYCYSDFNGGGYEGFGGLYSGIFSGSCGAFMEEDCTTRFTEGSNTYVLNVEEPIPGETYYVYVSMYSYIQYCNFNISTSTGIETCCGPDVTINAVCDTTALDSYNVDITINDLADNPSGYTVNGGSLPDITSTGTAQVGPFPVGIHTITLTGKDDASCMLTFKVEDNCIEEVVYDCSNPKPITVSPEGECEEVESIFPDQVTGKVPACFEDNYGYYGSDSLISADYFFSFTVPPSGIFKISNGYFNYAIYDDCNSTELSCHFPYSDEEFTIFEAGQELILQVYLQFPESFILCIEEIVPVDPADNNDCENAIPICGGIVSGDTEGATSNENDPISSCTYYEYFAERGTLWYTFETDNSGAEANFYIKENCEYDESEYAYGFYDKSMTATIYSGSCENTFNEESCIYVSTLGYEENVLNLLKLENPQPSTRYYLVIRDFPNGACPFEIISASGIANCCNADIAISPICNDDNKDQFYLDIQVNDLGDNPSGYTVNSGAFENITSTGTTTIGPFDNGFEILTLTGLDDATCEISKGVEENCGLVPNNFCSNAIPIDLESPFTCIQLGRDNYPYTIFGRDDLDDELQFANGDCVFSNSIYKDVYYEVTVPQSGGFYVYNDFDYYVTSVAYDGCNGEVISCNKEEGLLAVKDRTPGEQIIIQFLITSANSTRFDFCFEERPADSPNDLCENAIEINCDTNFYGSNANATATNNDATTSCGAPQKTIWYKVKPTGSRLWLRINDSNTNLTAAYLSGPCGGPYVTERCVSFGERTALVLSDPVIGQEYFIQISGNINEETTFQIIVDEGLRSCDELCQPIIDLTASCPNGYEDNAAYIDIDMVNLGENPSGYIVNGGDFPNITSIGITTVGPFSPGIAEITLEGLDVPGCVLSTSFSSYCVPPPANDFCENAFELNCNSVFSATNAGSTISEDEPTCTNGNPPDNTVWYRFVPESDDLWISIDFEGVDDIHELSASIYKGNCGDDLERIRCETYFYRQQGFYLRDLNVGETYYLQVVGLHDFEGEYDIIVSEGLRNCVAPELTFLPKCPNGEEDSIYIDINVVDLGDNPSGLTVEAGAAFDQISYPNITTTGVTTLGPFAENEVFITLKGIDQVNTIIQKKIEHYCSCDAFVAQGPSIYQGDSIRLNLRFQGSGINFDCEEVWVTDLNDPEGSLVGTGTQVYVSPQDTTTYYAITDCLNGINCEVAYTIPIIPVLMCDEDITGYYPYLPGCESDVIVELYDTRGNLLDNNPTLNDETANYTFTNVPYPCEYEVVFSSDSCEVDLTGTSNCDELVATVSSGSVLFWGYGYYNYSFQTELSIEIQDTLSCDFLYWVTDLSNPTQSIVSSEENATIDIFGGANITYYGIVVCEDDQVCVEDITIHTPIFDYNDYPYPIIDETDEDYDGVNGPIDPILPFIPCLTISAIDVIDIKNCDDPDGIITASVSGSAAIQYSIDEGVTWQTSNIFTNLTAGDYQLLVKYVDGTCTVEGSVVTVNPPADYDGEFTITCPSETVINLCAPVSAPTPLTIYDFGIKGCDNSSAFTFEVEEITEVNGLSISYLQNYTITNGDDNVTTCQIIYNTTSEFLTAPEIQQPAPTCAGDLLGGIKIPNGTFNFYSDDNGSPGDLISTCDYGGIICSTEGFVVDLNTPGMNTIWVTQFAANDYGAACESAATPIVFQVLPLPQAALTTNATEVCFGETLMLIDNVADRSNGVWSGPGVVSVNDMNDNTVYMFNGAGLAMSSPVKIFYTINNGMCEQNYTLTVQIDETPIEYWNSPDVLCFGDARVDLNNFLTSGIDGEWTGFGVSSEGMFNAASGPGTYPISFIANDPQACNNVQVREIVVNPTPDASFEMVNSVCIDDDAINLMSLLLGDAGGIFSGDGVENNMFVPAMVTGSEAAITYSVTAAGCTSELTIVVTVTRVNPPTGASPEQVVCADAAVIALSVENIYPFTYNWYSGDGVTFMGAGNEILISVPDDLGAYTFMAEAISPNGCASEALTEIYVEVVDCNNCATIFSADVNTNLACSGEVAEFMLTLNDSEANSQFVYLTEPDGNTISLQSVGNGQYFGTTNLVNTNCAPLANTYTITAYCSDNETVLGEQTEEIIIYPSTIEQYITVSPSEDGCTATATVIAGCEAYITPIGDWVSVYDPENPKGVGFDYDYYTDAVMCFNSPGTFHYSHNCDEPQIVECGNEAGLMQTSQTYVCGGDQANYGVAFSNNDENSVTGFVLHEGEFFDPATTTIIAANATGVFGSPGSLYHNMPLYISAVTGYPDANGIPQLNNECTVWTPYGAYTIFLDPVATTIVSEECVDDFFYVTVYVNGGIGVISPNAAYLTVTDGTTTFASISADEEVTFGPYAAGTNYQIDVIDVKGCSGVYSGTANCGGANKTIITRQQQDVVLLNSFPNPFKDKLNLNIYSNTNDDVMLSLTNMLGSNLIDLQLSLQQGNNSVELNTIDFPTGLYLLNIQSEKGNQYLKLLKD